MTATIKRPWAQRPAQPARVPGHRMVAVYVRISADDKGDALGVIRQHKLATSMAPITAEPVTFVVFDDNNKSASNGEYRPEYHALVDDWLPSGCIDEIRTYWQKRFWRLLDEGEHVRRACEAAGITTIRNYRDGDTTWTGNGRKMARFTSMMDTDYAETISQLVRDKKRELAEAGKPMGMGMRTFGYTHDRSAIVPAEAALIREAATGVINGDSLHAITNEWATRGVTTSTGKTWRDVNLRKLLTSPTIAGLSHHKGEIVCEAQWPAILDRKTWDKVVVALTFKTKRVAPGRRLLTGLLVCGRCGETMVASGNNGLRAYTCKGGGGLKGCNRLTVKAEPVEQLLVDQLLGRTDKTKTRAAKTITAARGALVDVESLKARKRELAVMFGKGSITGDQLMAATATIDEELGEAETLAADVAEREVLLPFLTQPGRLRDEWGGKLDDRTRRAIIHAAYSSVVIMPATKRGVHNFDYSRIVPRWAI